MLTCDSLRGTRSSLQAESANSRGGQADSGASRDPDDIRIGKAAMNTTIPDIHDQQHCTAFRKISLSSEDALKRYPCIILE